MYFNYMQFKQTILSVIKCQFLNNSYILHSKLYFLFQNDNKNSRFEDKWPEMRPVVLKLLQQEPVSQNEWQDLFYGIHLVCLWDELGPSKMRQSLKTDIMEFINNAQQVITLNNCLEL